MTEKVEQCLVIIKPDGLVKSLTGDIISKLAETKLTIVGAKIVSVSRELAERHYHKLKEAKGEAIFEATLKYIMGHYHTNRVLVMVYEGEDAIAKIRELAGATNPEKAEPTTIRGKYGRIHSDSGVFENVMHASEDGEQAEREIKLWFKPDELVSKIYPNETKQETVEYSYWK
ncbi:nucleoside-diphosphate kinase [Candidatus Woesearchaeota archaeon]|nr:nucleoside-diphosphate kinase [Candidatus Woesearchaeota archaeon]